jgi:surface antigen
MFGRGSSYTGVGNLRQSPFALRAIAAAFLTLSLGGCAGMGLPFDEATSSHLAANGDSARPILASATVADRVDPSDWEMVRYTVASAPKGAVANIDWLNPDTGSTGTINTTASAANGKFLCRSFATTVNDLRGIRRYRGEACAPEGGRWQLRSVTPDDAAIS